MTELTWQDILHAQQQDFINRLEISSKSNSDLTDFLRFSSVEIAAKSDLDLRGLNAEIIELSFPADEETDSFCDGEYSERYSRNLSVNSSIDKLGIAAIKAYLFGLLDDKFDNEDNLYLANNSRIKFKVKTQCLKKDICQEDNENELDEAIFDDFSPDLLAESKNIEWTITPEESNQNQILICVLFLTPILAEEVYRKYYKCLMAGFIPLKQKSASQSFKMNELFYMGGIRAYLESL
jgi:hypothetical protein